MTRPVIAFQAGELERLVATEWPGVARDCGVEPADVRPYARSGGAMRLDSVYDHDASHWKALRGLLDALEDRHLVEVDRDAGRVLGWAAAIVWNVSDLSRRDRRSLVKLASLDLHDRRRERWSAARLDERLARITPERDTRRETAMASARAAAASWEAEERARRAGR